MVTMTYKNDQKYRASSSSGKKAREAAQESAECRRHGYTMTDKTLGTGAYAKVRLARVGEKKLEKCAKLKQDLNEKGHDMVRNLGRVRNDDFAYRRIGRRARPSRSCSRSRRFGHGLTHTFFLVRVLLVNKRKQKTV